jgi:hypothetical protein
VTRLGVLLLRPYERWWAWYVKRQYRRGRFARPSSIGSGAVTTKQKAEV